MSKQLYTYEYRKPRHSNPTFISSNISHSLSYYNPAHNASFDLNAKSQINSGRYVGNEAKSYMKESRSDFSLPKINKNEHRENISLNNIEIKRQNNNFLGQYDLNIIDSGNQVAGPIPEPQNAYKRSVSNGQLYKKHSKLLPSSIDQSFVNFNEKDVFMKQCHNYNIITYQAKQYNEHIKKYPKLSLQQKDQYFRLKYINDPKYSNQDNRAQINPEINQYEEQSKKLSYEKNKNLQRQKMAGLHTYRQSNSHRNSTPITKVYEQNQQKIKSDIIQRGLDAPNTRISPSNTKLNPRSSKFNMKLLSNMDEFNYYA